MLAGILIGLFLAAWSIVMLVDEETIRELVRQLKS
jgi:hypothetical protein